MSRYFSYNVFKQNVFIVKQAKRPEAPHIWIVAERGTRLPS